MKQNDMLLYHLADTLGFGLKQCQDDRWRVAAVKEVKIGPWKMSAEVVGVSDVVSEGVVTFVVRIMGGVWLYVISKEAGSRIIVFDGGVLNLKVKDAAGTFTGKSVAESLKKIEKATRGVFEYNGQQWVEAQHASTVECPAS